MMPASQLLPNGSGIPSHAAYPAGATLLSAPAGTLPLRVLDLFPGYTIREDGEVRSRFGRTIRHQVSKNGYVRVELWAGGKGKKHLLHRLLAEAFIPNPEGKPQVNHIDGDKANNALSNLEWVTQSENQAHAYRMGLQKGYRKPGPISEAHKRALRGSRWKHEIRHYRCAGRVFRRAKDAACHFNVTPSTIANRCKSERWPEWSLTIERR
jgi:hypothetical protein